MRRRLLALLASAAMALGISVGMAAQAEASTGYKSGSCQPAEEIGDRGLTWFKASSWINSNGTKTYHFSVREDGGFHGTGWHEIRYKPNWYTAGTKWFGSSPYDNNPVEKYKTVSGTGNRRIVASWTDYLGGLPTVPFPQISCAITL